MATVELALCLPVLVSLAFGTIEICNVVYLRTRMLSAAYEACRLATRPTTSSQVAATGPQVITYCNSLLTQLGVNGATVTLFSEQSDERGSADGCRRVDQRAVESKHGDLGRAFAVADDQRQRDID